MTQNLQLVSVTYLWSTFGHLGKEALEILHIPVPEQQLQGLSQR